MSQIEKTIVVEAPLEDVYAQWTQFEEFPRFMDGVERVVQLDDRTLEWTATVAGREKRWTARIVDQTPDVRIAWRGLDGARNDGAVLFTWVDAGTTEDPARGGRRARWHLRGRRRSARVPRSPGQRRPRPLQGVHRGARRPDGFLERRRSRRRGDRPSRWIGGSRRSGIGAEHVRPVSHRVTPAGPADCRPAFRHAGPRSIRGTPFARVPGDPWWAGEFSGPQSTSVATTVPNR